MAKSKLVASWGKINGREGVTALPAVFILPDNGRHALLALFDRLLWRASWDADITDSQAKILQETYDGLLGGEYVYKITDAIDNLTTAVDNLKFQLDVSMTQNAQLSALINCGGCDDNPLLTPTEPDPVTVDPEDPTLPSGGDSETYYLELCRQANYMLTNSLGMFNALMSAAATGVATAAFLATFATGVGIPFAIAAAVPYVAAFLAWWTRGEVGQSPSDWLETIREDLVCCIMQNDNALSAQLCMFELIDDTPTSDPYPEDFRELCKGLIRIGAINRAYQLDYNVPQNYVYQPCNCAEPEPYDCDGLFFTLPALDIDNANATVVNAGPGDLAATATIGGNGGKWSFWPSGPETYRGFIADVKCYVNGVETSYALNLYAVDGSGKQWVASRIVDSGVLEIDAIASWANSACLRNYTDVHEDGDVLQYPRIWFGPKPGDTGSIEFVVSKIRYFNTG